MSLQTVLNQIDSLAHFYRDYSAESARLEQQHTGIRRLGELFSGMNKFSNDSMHAKFYEDVQARVAELDQSISALTDPQEACSAAWAAINIIFQPVPEENRDAGAWMRFAAEPLCQPFLAYLDQAHLSDLYERYNQIYPKRLQFPNQVKLRKAMEQLLKK